MLGVSNTSFDFRVIRPLLSGLSATAENVTPSMHGLGFWNPSAGTVHGTQASSRSGALGPEERSLTGAPESPFV